MKVKVKVKVKGPNMCYIFEKHGIQGYRIWHSRVSNVKYTNTQICKYTNTKCLKDPICAIFLKSWWFKYIKYDHHIIKSIWQSVSSPYGRHSISTSRALVAKRWIQKIYSTHFPNWALRAGKEKVLHHNNPHTRSVWAFCWESESED